MLNVKTMDLFADLPGPSASMPSSNNMSLKSTSKTDMKLTSLPNLFDSLPEASNLSSEELGRCGKRKSSEENENTSRKKTLTDLIKLKGYTAERKGEREEMQDRHIIINDFHSRLSGLTSDILQISYYAVFDGHAGARASQFAADNLHKNLSSRLLKDFNSIEKDIKKCFIDIFKKTDEEFLKLAKKSKPSWKDGTTATIILVVNNTLYIASLGDTKAVICRTKEENKISALPLTIDHSPTQFEERARIQRAGGVVRDGRVMGVLEVSRSIGDGQFKTCGITCIPDVKRYQLTDRDRFIILACDGLWKVFSPDAAIGYVNCVLQNSSLTASETKSHKDVAFEISCNKIANEAVRRGCADNVTVMLISIGEMITL